MTAKTILLTGGTGALGRVLAGALRGKGHRVVCSSRQIARNDLTIQTDLTDIAQVSAAIQTIRPEMVIHLAATFGSDFDESYAVNVQSARHLITAIRALNLTTRVVLAGSAAEYRVLRPVSVYGLTKSWQTNFGLMCAHQGDDVLVARIFNLWGQGLSRKLFAGRVDEQIRQVLTGHQQRISVGPLSAIRDYVSLELAADQLTAIVQLGHTGHIYHVGSGKPISMRDLLKNRLFIEGLSLDIVDENHELSTRAGYDVPAIYADMSQTNALFAKIENVQS